MLMYNFGEQRPAPTHRSGQHRLKMPARKIGPFHVARIGLGCMNLSHAYGTPPTSELGAQLLLHALERGVTLFDTAPLYGFGENEKLIGAVLARHRSSFVLATKAGMYGMDGRRVIDARPQTIKDQMDLSLRRLRTDCVDLLYLHRWDKKIPIEDSIGAMGDLVREGKARALGLSEVSAERILRAHAVHPIVAVQTEYSLWTRNAEIGALEACRSIGAAFVAFSPLARGWLTNTLVPSEFIASDIRRGMPRFQANTFAQNQPLLKEFVRFAIEVGCTPAQLALAWLLNRAPHVIPIPGTRSIAHFDENMGAITMQLDRGFLQRLDQLFEVGRIVGERYPAATQAEIDTEEFGKVPSA
jgi:aryl-alcohol dehydrogenase-like predicted oxidoreductase